LNNLGDHTALLAELFDFNKSGFEEKALAIFRFQAAHNPVYRQYIDLLGLKADFPGSLQEIPFMPISFFKTHSLITGDWEPELVFESSGTTGMVNSRHLVKDASLYRKSFMAGFRKFYGDPREWCVIGLLPSYLERKNSSLVYMVDELVRQSLVTESGFYLYDHRALYEKLLELEQRGQKTLLIGVTFALLDFAERFTMDLRHTIVMETGGMKGRREELTRQQVHDILCHALGVEHIHSEYGMTELLSQAYSPGDGIFHCGPTMRVLLRHDDDPLSIIQRVEHPVRGVINVVDLANIWSCSFVATEDAGILHPNGSFEVIGRVDHSDIRGCSLMVV
jgi:hypothetical protein